MTRVSPLTEAYCKATCGDCLRCRPSRIFAVESTNRLTFRRSVSGDGRTSRGATDSANIRSRPSKYQVARSAPSLSRAEGKMLFHSGKTLRVSISRWFR